MPISEVIADAATRLMTRHGPDGFSMDQLAAEAGLSRATLYRQAGSRGAVLAALSARGVKLAARVDVRERILTAARAVFTRAGFEAATLEDIAREAGVGPATVYRQFSDKDGLVSAFADQVGPRRAMREAAVQPSGDLRADLERVAAAVMREVARDIDLLRLTLLERLRGGRWADLLKNSPLRSLPMLTRLLKPYVDSGALGAGDPGVMAQAFAGMLFSFFLRAALDGGPMPDPEETARFITHVFLDGLASPLPRRS
jgi:TetR/AcrR family transcriptional repressor of mexJK operon